MGDSGLAGAPGARRLRWPLRACAALALAGGLAPAAPPPSSTALEQLEPGEFAWLPELAPAGPLLLVVSLDEQQAHLYRNGVRIAVTTVSSGKPGNETPEGVYTILQKREEHYSNLYDNAPMPYMQRLTWDGIALHAGRLPGYPASHGCVRLPEEFARRLFGLTSLGMTVVVAGERTDAPQLSHPGWLAPSVPGIDQLPVPAGQDAFWAPERAPEGPLTILVSTADRVIRVLRNGTEIGRAGIRLDGAPPAGAVVLQLQAGTQPGENALVPGRPRLNWVRLVVDAGGAEDVSLRGRLHVPPQFARQLYDALEPGATAVVTDARFDAAPGMAPVLEATPER